MLLLLLFYRKIVGKIRFLICVFYVLEVWAMCVFFEKCDFVFRCFWNV